MIDYAAINVSLYQRVATSSDGAAVRALLGVFPAGAPDGRAATRAYFQYDKLKLYAGKGVTFPWLVWRPLDANGESGQMQAIGGAWWAYAGPLTDTRPLFHIRSALEALYGAPGRLAVPWGRVNVVFRGRPIEDASLGNISAMETRIIFVRR